MAGPEEALGEVPGEAGLHLSQSLEGTAGNWAGGLLPGERSRQNVKYIIDRIICPLIFSNFSKCYHCIF